MKKQLDGVRMLLMNTYGHTTASIIKDFIKQIKDEESDPGAYREKDILFMIESLKIAIDIHKEYFVSADIDFVELEKYIDRVYPKISRNVKLKKILK